MDSWRSTPTMTTEAPVKSPCVEICVLNEQDVCVGCYRTANEITEWTVLDNERKAEVVALAAERRREDGGIF